MKMLETIRCKALNQFKEEFPKALKKRRTEFQAAVCDSTKSCMTAFDKECEGTKQNISIEHLHKAIKC